MSIYSLGNIGTNPNSDAAWTSNDASVAFEHLVSINRAANQSFFLKGFRHKLNTPINSVILGGELLHSFVHDLERLFEALEDKTERLPKITSEIKEKYLTFVPAVIKGIKSSACKLNLLVSHLSEFTDTSDTARKNHVDINHIVSQCASMLDHQICAFTDYFQLILEPDIPTLTGNGQHLLQVILNLLINSLLSLPDKSCEVTLSTSCRRDTGHIQVSIRDTGMGIPPDILPRITEPFFTTWSTRGCAGLGLTIADRIIRDHGGALRIASTPGKGTCAIASFPVDVRTKTCGPELNHG